MTDKELRRLSRLELLELLLEAEKENDSLKQQIEKLRSENKINKNIENLQSITRQAEKTLRYANSLSDTLKTTSDKLTSAKNTPSNNFRSQTDLDIYKHMLSFFAKNDDQLSIFPDELENTVRARINSILEKRKQKKQ